MPNRAAKNWALKRPWLGRFRWFLVILGGFEVKKTRAPAYPRSINPPSKPPKRVGLGCFRGSFVSLRCPKDARVFRFSKALLVLEISQDMVSHT